ncbi:MAG: hypothetical protein JSU66_13380 [Deltaproteobacteria bacterium]|nr:MAG: hypothetical protein JSU66_13380 [Deltaproteobacteria bacterium]
MARIAVVAVGRTVLRAPVFVRVVMTAARRAPEVRAAMRMQVRSDVGSRVVVVPVVMTRGMAVRRTPRVAGLVRRGHLRSPDRERGQGAEPCGAPAGSRCVR